ncbi:MAG TPA: heat-inducible transcriptional repressor HrcA [Rhizobiaceae bacterium]|nr:heat-inducible transcriptional repressor HrcA [Rhizobiaceae bacterium]
MSKLSAPDGPANLDERSREIFRRIVESYLIDGEPVGSRNLSRLLPVSLSPASVRNVMSDLEYLGLIYSPHVSAGRLPTQRGLRLFVDAYMETGTVASEERKLIEAKLAENGRSQDVETVLTEATELLSDLSRGAGLVLATKGEGLLKHIEFVRLDPDQALAVLVWESGEVENRVIRLPAGITASQLAEAANFLNHHLRGRSLADARAEIDSLREATARELDELSRTLVDSGLAVWGSAATGQPARLIVRGRSNLISNLGADADMERLRLLFDDLERKEGIIQLLDLAEEGSGVRIFIGSENKLFSMSGSSLVLAPYRDSEKRVVGALGVIGPTRLNYARVVPMVDFTAQLVSRLLR